MSVSIELPKEYGYVILSGTFTILVNFWHGVVVTGARKAAGIPYPYAYAEKSAVEAADNATAERMTRFNSAQRAHGNFLENHTNNLALILLSGLKYPVAASALGVFWSLNRVLFALGYMDTSKKAGNGRYRGIGHFAAFLGLLGLTGKTGYDLVMS